ncbi:MAG: RHS repeat-associated core domain-containing protein, partial [Bacteroidota bacterium]
GGLYNGNISWMNTWLKGVGDHAEDDEAGMQAMLYRYDQLNRIKRSRGLTDYTTTNGYASRTEAEAGRYDTDYAYDGNGNLQILDRRDHNKLVTDKLTYSYIAGTNQLEEVNGTGHEAKNYGDGTLVPDDHIYPQVILDGNVKVASGDPVAVKATEKIVIKPGFVVGNGATFSGRITNEAATETFEIGSYEYDAIGNLIRDNVQGTEIDWTVYGKVAKVTRDNTQVTDFHYDPAGNRVKKTMTSPVGSKTTFYIRDASGNIMATYEQESSGEDAALKELPIYGSSRLGEYRGKSVWGELTLGERRYEVSNHLGNVLSTFTDELQVDAEGNRQLAVLSASDYYPFGMQMPGRNLGSGSYRYGFQGQEQDGETGFVNYKYRMHDPRIGRFFAVDPLSHLFPWNSSYAFSENKVIASIELEGLESVDLNSGKIIDMPGMVELKKLSSEDYGFWRDMLLWEKSPEYRKVFDMADGGRVLDEQEMDWAYGDALNNDYYAVNITKLPKGMSQQDLYSHIRKNFADFMNKDVAKLEPGWMSGSGDLWDSEDPTGAVMTFHDWRDDAAVLTTQAGKYHWVFTPVGTGVDFEHPLAGHRQFGLSANDNGTLTFYTRGVDMMWDFEDNLYNRGFGIFPFVENDDNFFKTADKLWNSVMDNVVNYINKNGGKAEKTHNFSRRIDWKKDVKDEDK